MSEDTPSLTKDEDLDPTVARTPTVLILDTSGSMDWDIDGMDKSRIDFLNDGQEFFKDEIENNNHAAVRVDIGVVTFGSGVTVDQEMINIEDWGPTELEPSGRTPMGGAIDEGLQLLEERKDGYKNDALPYNRPLVWLLTDGEPTDMEVGDQTWDKVQNLIDVGTDDKHFLFFAVGVGDDANMDKLNKLTSVVGKDQGKTFPLEEGMFDEFFRIVSETSQKASEQDSEAEDVAEEVEEVASQVDANSA
jgi:uncharacterized protein YegL